MFCQNRRKFLQKIHFQIQLQSLEMAVNGPNFSKERQQATGSKARFAKSKTYN
jgi:hypothetical protein